MSRKLTIDLILSEMNLKTIANLVALNINGKCINDISILSQIPSLEIITLNNNDISNLSVFKNLKNLKKLSLKANKINDFAQVEYLRYCPKLEYLKLKENPITKDKNYLKTIFEILPKLKILDDIEVNKIINNMENKNVKTDNKNIDGINNEAKYIKLTTSKIRNNFNLFNPNSFSGSSMKQANLKMNNNIINQINKKSSKENIISNYEKNDNNIEKDNYKKNTNQNDNDEDDFEIININDEKKKKEIENKKYQKIEPKPKPKAEVSSYWTKKKSSTGSFFYNPKKRKQNSRTDSINFENNEFFNTFNEEHKNMIYNYSTARYNKKIIKKINANNNALSQSIRYDDNEDDNNKNGIYSRKNKLASIKNRILNNIKNKIYNKSKNKDINDKENEKEKTIIKSIKLLLTNLDEEELKQINDNLTNLIESKSKK